MPTRRDKTGPLNNHFLRPASLSLTTSESCAFAITSRAALSLPVTNSKVPGRHVADYDRTGTDDCALADRDAVCDDGVARDPDVWADRSALVRETLESVRSVLRNLVTRTVDLHARTEHRVCADSQAARAIEYAKRADVSVLADLHDAVLLVDQRVTVDGCSVTETDAAA